MKRKKAKAPESAALSDLARTHSEGIKSGGIEAFTFAMRICTASGYHAAAIAIYGEAHRRYGDDMPRLD